MNTNEPTKTFTVVSSTDGTFHVHRAGCADLDRREAQRCNGMRDEEAVSVDALVAAQVAATLNEWLASGQLAA